MKLINRNWPLLALVLTLVPLSLLAADKGSKDRDMALIVTQTAIPSKCLAPVAIQQIDGREKNVSPQGFSIEPGEHSMNGRAAIDTTYCKPIRGYRSEPVPPLVADFEAGKTYYVGFDHSSSNRRDWQLVIWKVEDRNSKG